MTSPTPTRRLLALAAAAFVSQLSTRVQAADLTVLLFDQGQPLANADVRVGSTQARTNADGSTVLQLGAGEHELVVSRDGETVLQLKLTLAQDESAELFATLYPDAAPSVFIDSSHANAGTETAAAADLGPPGRFSGQILNSEDGKPVANARVYVAGTPLDIITDAEGRFDVPVSPGSYAVSIIAPKFASRSLEAIAITSGETTTQRIELTPSGVELPEFVVLEPFIEGSLASFVEEKRNSSAVADILGAEQISRAGDSDAAGALKRVTGLTLVDGKYIYVRGLGERYSSTLLNGGQIPSPDPTRRVIPLDLFPAELLSGIVVQKTYSANLPAEFAGGTVLLRTRGVPESFLLRTSVGMGYGDGTTGSDGLRYDGGQSDWTGRDDGTREAPDALNQPALPTAPAELEAVGEALAAGGYSLREERIGPNTSASVSIGDDFPFSDGDWSLGYIASVRHAQNWDSREEERNLVTLGVNGLRLAQEGERARTERNIDNAMFLAAGLKIGEHHSVTATALQLRQTADEAQYTDILESGDLERRHSLEWIENELQSTQLGGEHVIPALGNLLVSWQMTQSDASRYAPNTREYRYRFDDAVNAFVVNPFSNQQRFENLQDQADEYRLDLAWPWEFSDAASIKLSTGASQFEKDRVSSIRRFAFAGGRPPGSFFDIDDFYTPEIIGPGSQQQRLREVTLATDAYTANQALDAYYFMADGNWQEWSVNLGARQEDILQEVITKQPFAPNATPVIGLVEESNLLPAGSLTWAYSDKAQVRLAYSETLSRPDIREQSPADFIDPQLDVRVVGNPDLVQTEITNLDLRWEYYFSPSESFSVALFQKDFLNPIELVASPASGSLLDIRNAESATNRGIEFDYYRSFDFAGRWSWLPWGMDKLPWDEVFLGFNYARIESEIDLGANPGLVTNAVRPLQGQSPYVGNISLAWLPESGRYEATLLYNVAGERISRVGIQGIPDTLEQPFDQVDFTLSAALPWEGWKLKARLRNLLDPEAAYMVGDLVERRFRKGREVAFNVEWRF